ncbi:hypothetical protein EV424DRAFT_1543829 [Suillus variegatus]|nr:hypothetical protein EV424DRAFT_1543829 [Suillus variegatus]
MAFSRHLIILALVTGCILPSGVQALWPIPTTLETGMTTLKISPTFYFDVQIEGTPSDLRDAVAQSQYYLENDKLGRLVVGRGSNDTSALATARTLSKLTLSLASGVAAEPISSEAVKPLGTRCSTRARAELVFSCFTHQVICTSHKNHFPMLSDTHPLNPTFIR